MEYNTKLFILIFFYLFTLISAVPTDLSCKGVSLRNSMDLYDCKFISSNSTDIVCQIYSESHQNSTIQPVSFVIGFRTVFYLKEKIYVKFNDSPVAKWWWCLGIRSSTLTRIDEVPSNAANVMLFPNAVAQLMSTLKDAMAHVEFHGTAAAGFVDLREDCDPETMTLDDSCIQRLKGSSYVIAPGDEDFSVWDILFNKILNLYFNTMGGVLKYLSVSTTITGAAASAWMSLLGKTNIQTLNASDNNLNGNGGVLPHKFSNLFNLTTLYLKNCRLSGIDPANFEGTPNLHILDVSGNLFTSPPKGISHLKHLQVLKVGPTNHKIPHFDLGPELAVTSLKELRLTGLPLNQIQGSSLPAPLEILDLTSCGLTSIPGDTFANLHSLKLLILTDNKLSTLHPNTFENIKLGGRVIISQNKIKVGQKLVVNELNLLDLSNNRITKPYNIISNGSIKYLDLSNNDIINWTSINTFNSKYYNINQLNLSNNNIPIIDSNMSPSLNTLSSVDIGGNQFNCQDCSLLEFKDWINTTKTEILLMGQKDTIRCSLPVQQKGEILMKSEYNITACDLQPPNYLLIAGTPIAISFTLLFTLLILYYSYRFEIAYMRHLYRVKRKHEKVSERDGCKYDVFVSYCGKDRDWVIDVLLPGLENPTDRYSLCLHERDFPLGSFIMDNIVSCIDQSRRVVLVLTENYIKSEWCKWELQMAQHRIFEECHDLLILLELERLSRDDVPLHLRVLMDSRTYLEWPGSNVEGLRTFWIRIKQALGTPLALSGTPEEEQEQEEEETDSMEEPLVPFQPMNL